MNVTAEQVTSCGFGDRHLDRPYGTTATEGWTDEQREPSPQAGVAYHCRAGARGLPAASFRPGREWWSSLPLAD